MITQNVGTKTCPLTREKAAFVAESLTAAVSGKPATALAFTSGMHGHISVMSKKSKACQAAGEKREPGVPIKSAAIRSRPDRLLRKSPRCLKKGFSLASGRYTVFVLPQNRLFARL